MLCDQYRPSALVTVLMVQGHSREAYPFSAYTRPSKWTDSGPRALLQVNSGFLGCLLGHGLTPAFLFLNLFSEVMGPIDKM